MTHRPIKILSDGSRIYADGSRYTPVAEEDRAYAVRRPPQPNAVRWFSDWLLPIDVLQDIHRVMPATRPFRDSRKH